MKFDKLVNTILEGVPRLKNYSFTLIDPFNYSEVLMEVPMEDDEGRTLYELHNVTGIKKRSIGDYRPNNLKFIKAEYLAAVPEDIENNWVKEYLIYGRDIVKYNKVLSASFLGVDTGSIYIIQSKTKINIDEIDMDDLTLAYLKPSDVAGEVKDTFSDMYSEL